jgi:hypothetical protein
MSATRIGQHINAAGSHEVGNGFRGGLSYRVPCKVAVELHVSRLKALIKELYGG